MKHFFKKNKHHFGLWALSGLILLWSIIWLNSLEKKTKEYAPSFSKVSINTTTSSSLAIKDESSATDITSTVIQITSPVTNSINSSPTSSVIGQEDQEKFVTFQFFSPNNEKKFQTSITENETVYQVMLRLKEEQGLTFEVKDYSGLGVFVESINGLANNPKENQFWIYYFNGKVAQMGISLTKIHPNDLITWHYENGKF